MTPHDATEQAYKNGYAQGRKDVLDEKCAELDKALAEADFLRAELKATETEFARMRAQLDIVYLIFGGQNR